MPLPCDSDSVTQQTPDALGDLSDLTALTEQSNVAPVVRLAGRRAIRSALRRGLSRSGWHRDRREARAGDLQKRLLGGTRGRTDEG